MPRIHSTLLALISATLISSACANSGAKTSTTPDLWLPPSVSAAERAEIAAGIDRMLPTLEALRDEIATHLAAMVAQIESVESGKIKGWEMDASCFNRYTLARSKHYEAARNAAGGNKLLSRAANDDADEQWSMKLAAIAGQIDALEGLWKDAGKRFNELHTLPPTGISDAEMKEVSESLAAVCKKHQTLLEALSLRAKTWSKAEIAKIEAGAGDQDNLTESALWLEFMANIDAYNNEILAISAAHPLYDRELRFRKLESMEPATSAFVAYNEVFESTSDAFFDVEKAKEEAKEKAIKSTD